MQPLPYMNEVVFATEHRRVTMDLSTTEAMAGAIRDGTVSKILDLRLLYNLLRLLTSVEAAS